MPKIEEVKSSSVPKAAVKPIKPLVKVVEEPDKDLSFTVMWGGDGHDRDDTVRGRWKINNGEFYDLFSCDVEITI